MIASSRSGWRTPATGDDVTVSTVIAQVWGHAKTYYRGADGSPTSEVDNFRQAMRPLRRRYGHTRAADFSPLCLKALRTAMTQPSTLTDPKTKKTKTLKGWCRTMTNRQIARVKMIFKWAAENELVSASVFHGLTTVSGLRRGRSDAREADPVRPVPQPAIDEVLTHLSPQVKAMVQLQLLTGARGGELRRMRTCDVDTSAKVWVYRPPEHKTAHHGHAREIRLGPKAIEVLAPMLKPDLQAIIFSPADADVWRREQARLKRKTPVQPSQLKRAEDAARNANRRMRRPRDRYTKDSYARAIARACVKAGVEPWHPHQLRHNPRRTSVGSTDSRRRGRYSGRGPAR